MLKKTGKRCLLEVSSLFLPEEKGQPLITNQNYHCWRQRFKFFRARTLKYKHVIQNLNNKWNLKPFIYEAAKKSEICLFNRRMKLILKDNQDN